MKPQDTLEEIRDDSSVANRCQAQQRPQPIPHAEGLIKARIPRNPRLEQMLADDGS